MSKQDSKLPAAKRFVYPFPGKDGKEIRDVGVYYKALAKAGEGYYPIGANGQWHGGVHFNNQTAAELDQKNGVRCIADGEVVAWRLDDTYPCVDYPVATDEDGEEVHGKLRAVYSTGFVLVRHRLEPPEASGKHNNDNTKGATASTDTDTKSSDQPSLTFYSLYMHLMCWDNYDQHINRERPTFWDGKITYRVGDGANDTCGKNSSNEFARTSRKKGINLRKKGAHGAYAGFAPKGSILRLGAAEANGFYEVESVQGDSVNPQNVNDAVVYKKELTAFPGKPETLGKVAVPDEPIAVKAGQLMGHLGIYERFKDAKPVEEATKPNADAATSNRQMMHLEVFTADDIKTFIEKSRKRSEELPDADKTLLLIEKGAQLAEPTAADMSIDGNNGVVVVDDENTSGYWTRVKRLSNRAIIPHQHCTGFENNQYTLQSGANAELTRQLGLTAAELTRTARWDGYYYDTDGTPNTEIPRYQAHGNNNDEYPNRGVHVVLAGEAWIESSHITANGSVTYTSARLPAWSKFPLDTGNSDGPQVTSQKVVEINTLDNLAKSNDGVRWWQVTVRTEAGNNASGWACESDQNNVSLCSPWAWPGFETFQDPTSPLELHAYRLISAAQIQPEEEADATSLARKAQTGPLLTRLCQILALKNDDRVTPDAIRKALESPDRANELSHLIIRHENEWSSDMSKWDALDKFMTGPTKSDWKTEKERINTVQWMDKVESLNETNLYVVHPICVDANFQGNCACNKDITKTDLELILPEDVKEKGLFYKATDKTVRNFDTETFIQLLNKHMNDHNIRTCIRKSMFLSQIMEESDELRTNEEYKNKDGSIPTKWKDYGGGSKYHGRGLIQLTHDTLYSDYASATGNEAIKNDPDIVSHNIEESIASACWYWRHGSTWGDCNNFADQNDFIKTTIAINGGFNGFIKRYKLLVDLARKFSAHTCTTNPDMIFHDYTFTHSSLSKSRWYRSNKSKCETLQTKLDKEQDNVTDI